MSPVVQCMESRAKTVVGVDWRNAITEDLRAGLMCVHVHITFMCNSFSSC